MLDTKDSSILYQEHPFQTHPFSGDLSEDLLLPFTRDLQMKRLLPILEPCVGD